MLIIKKQGEESIERMLKRFKTKVSQTGIIKEVRKRKQFDKPSVIKRENKMKAINCRIWDQKYK